MNYTLWYAGYQYSPIRARTAAHLQMLTNTEHAASICLCKPCTLSLYRSTTLGTRNRVVHMSIMSHVWRQSGLERCNIVGSRCRPKFCQQWQCRELRQQKYPLEQGAQCLHRFRFFSLFFPLQHSKPSEPDTKVHAPVTDVHPVRIRDWVGQHTHPNFDTDIYIKRCG